MLVKSVSSEVKDLDEKGLVKFYFSFFDNVDSDGDITHKGAFTKSIKENRKRIKHFKNHHWTETPGVLKELYEDEKGAIAVSQLILGTQLGKDTYEEYRAGAITEHSFGYEIVNSDKETIEEKEVQHLRELKLDEVSSLNSWGANEMTDTLDVKNQDQVMKFLESLEALKKGEFSDEYFEKLENKIAVVQKYLESLREPPQHSIEPVDYILKHSRVLN